MKLTTIHTTNKSHRTATFLIGLALFSIIPLAGCTPTTPKPTNTNDQSHTPTPTMTPTPTPTPTPTNAAVPEPQTEDEAISGAQAVIAQYLRIRAEVNTSGGLDTTPLQAVSTEGALKLAVDDAGRIAADHNKVIGQIMFEKTSASVGSLKSRSGTVWRFASVSVTGCQDGSNYNLFNPDGSPALQPKERRNVFEFTTFWDPTSRTWLVKNVTATGPTC